MITVLEALNTGCYLLGIQDEIMDVLFYLSATLQLPVVSHPPTYRAFFLSSFRTLKLIIYGYVYQFFVEVLVSKNRMEKQPF